jgi:hypothetical protein
MLAIIGCIWIASVVVGACSVVATCVSVGVSSHYQGKAEDRAEDMEDLNEQAMADQKRTAEYQKKLKLDMSSANQREMYARVGSSVTLDQIATKKARLKAGKKRSAMGGNAGNNNGVRTPRPQHQYGKTVSA